MEADLAKVFLSYAREDAPVAKELAECIGRGGHDVWWDRQIHGGSRFASEIDRELKGADAVVPATDRGVAGRALPSIRALERLPDGTRMLWASSRSGEYPFFLF